MTVSPLPSRPAARDAPAGLGAALADLARAHLARGNDPDSAGTPLTGGVRPHTLLITTTGALAPPPRAGTGIGHALAGSTPGSGHRLGTRRPQPTPAQAVSGPKPTWPWARLAELDGIGPVSGESARRLTCDTALHPLLAAGDWQPLAYSRTQRTVPPALRRAIALRDGGCRFAGCDRPAPWCDAHHLVHWAHGGSTDPDNLALVCAHHHHLLHEGGYQLTRSDHGGFTTPKPDGTQVPDHPRAHDRAHAPP